MHRLSWKSSNDIKYLFINFKKIEIDEAELVSKELVKILQEVDKINILIDCSNLKISFAIYNVMRNVAKKAQPKVNKACYIGINTSSKAVYNVYKVFSGSKAKTLDTIEEGLQYITG